MIKVMIVDDEPFIRQGLRILIDWEKYGYSICAEAANGKEAAEKLRAEEYDLVITDIKMPNMNGIELIEYTWLNISKQVRFILLSGFYEFEYAKKAIKYGAVDYILKPVQKEELIKILINSKELYPQHKEDGKELDPQHKEDSKGLYPQHKEDKRKSENLGRMVLDPSLTLNKEMMDQLVRDIEENDTEKILNRIELIYEHFKRFATDPDIIKINLDYLLFNLISLAKELDPDRDQKEVLRMINQSGYEQISVRVSVKHFKEFALKYAKYLTELRHHALSGVLADTEKEITEHYMENLSLKSLSEKYYINSAYLGQIFKKKFGITFKDYLNNYRIDRAAEMLLRSNEKIYLIANAVGQNNTDYFISKFVQAKGLTPLQYRKQLLRLEKEEKQV